MVLKILKYLVQKYSTECSSAASGYTLRTGLSIMAKTFLASIVPKPSQSSSLVLSGLLRSFRSSPLSSGRPQLFLSFVMLTLMLPSSYFVRLALTQARTLPAASSSSSGMLRKRTSCPELSGRSLCGRFSLT